MHGEIILLTLNTPIHNLPINQHLNIDGGDVVVSISEDTGHGTYTVRVDEIDDNRDEVQYNVSTEDGVSFLVPKSYITSIQFATEDEEMMFTLALNSCIYNDELNNLASMINSRISSWISGNLTPGDRSEIINDLRDVVNTRYLKSQIKNEE